jgi:integrase
MWTAPAERMKAQRERQVPLSDAALQILRSQLATRRRQSYVFPGKDARSLLSNMAMTMTVRRLREGEYAVHGFRGGFLDWAAEHGVDDSVAEQCLAHKIGTAVARARSRTTVLQRRRKVMANWATFLTGENESGTKGESNEVSVRS